MRNVRLVRLVGSSIFHEEGCRLLVTITIDGQKVTVPEGTTILEAARLAGVHIPTLCYLKEINEIGACRVCLVEIEGSRKLQAACVYPVSDNMVVYTNSPRVRKARKSTVEMILSDHPQECLTCIRNGSCELQTLARDLGLREISYTGARHNYPIDDSSPSIVRDPNKCILCRRCIAVCSEVQGLGILGALERGFDTVVAPAWQQNLTDTACTNCGQCVVVCPTGALSERDDTEKVFAALADPDKHVVVQTAPAVRVALGEEFGMEPGAIVTGKMVAALRRLGFDRVFDTDFSADLTIMEEANEFLHRVQSGGKLPLITSCSPGWIKFIEHNYPDMLEHLSTCKSPQQMFGALVKTYYARKANIDPAKIVSVSIMPCTAKKYEAQRPEMNASGYRDVDYVLTTRELARMLRSAGINWDALEPEEFDAPLGISTGAGLIFGATGGVMEAALRTAYEVATKKELPKLDFTEVRGLEGIKEAEIDLDGRKIKVAVAHTLANARKVLDAIRSGEAEYHFVEIMACPGGCIGGGGQPRPVTDEVRQKRIDAIYEGDRNMPLRKSHENPAIKTLYEEFLGKPNSEIAHRLLHTSYTKRNRYPNQAEIDPLLLEVVSAK